MKIYLLRRKSQLSQESEKKGRVRKTSLFLAYYSGSSRSREYEFLNLSLYEKPKNQLEKDHNKETLALAEAIKAKKILEAQSSQHGFVSSVMGKTSFLAYFKELTEKKHDSEGNYGNWLSTYRHLVAFCEGKDLLMNQVDDLFLERFKEYLLTSKIRRGNKEQPLAQNTALSYFNKVRTAIKEAFTSRKLKENPVDRVKGIKTGETHREYLTFEELQLLVNTPCEIPVMRNAFLFSALTGLRFSDVKALTWQQLKFSEAEGWHIQFIQQKTKGAQTLPISEQAIKFIGARGESSTLIFEGLVYSAWHNIKLRGWVMDAGISKKITFHCARHSFATLQLSMNTDIYTVSKMLGHKHLKTTEIYAKVIDKKKMEAAGKFPELTL